MLNMFSSILKPKRDSVIKFDAMFKYFIINLSIFFCSKLHKYLVDKSTSLKEGGVSQPILFIHVNSKTSKIMYVTGSVIVQRFANMNIVIMHTVETSVTKRHMGDNLIQTLFI